MCWYINISREFKSFIKPNYILLCIYRLLESDLIKFHKSRLKLAAVSVEDNGVYSCEASNPAGKTTSLQNFILSVPGKNVKIVLFVFFPPVFIMYPIITPPYQEFFFYFKILKIQNKFIFMIEEIVLRFLLLAFLLCTTEGSFLSSCFYSIQTN